MAESPCEKDMPCLYEYFDYSEDCMMCSYGENGWYDCPYVKPWGKTKYRRDNQNGAKRKVAVNDCTRL